MSDHTASKPLSVYVCPLRWGDMDALGHLNNTLYFRFFEQARIEWLGSLGCAVGRHVEEGPILVSAACNFRVQVVYPGNVRIVTRAKKVGNSSFSLIQTLSREETPDVIAADGEVTNVWCDYRLNQSKPIPDGLRAVLLDSIP